MQEPTNMIVVSAFAHEWAICAGAKSVLYFDADTFITLCPVLCSSPDCVLVQRPAGYRGCHCRERDIFFRQKYV